MTNPQSNPQPERESGYNYIFQPPLESAEVVYDESSLLEELMPHIDHTKSVIDRYYDRPLDPLDTLRNYVPNQEIVVPLYRRLDFIINSMFAQCPPEVSSYDFEVMHLSDVVLNLGKVSTQDWLDMNREKYQTKLNATQIFAQSFENYVAQDGSYGYMAAKLMSRDPLTLPDERAIQMFVNDYLVLAQESGGPRVPDNTKDQLVDGSFDTYIAEDLLTQLVDLASNEMDDPAHGEAMGMIALIQSAASLDQAEAIKMLAKPESIKHWPNSVQQLLKDNRNFLARGIQDNINSRRKFAYQCGHLLNKTTVADLKSFLNKNPAYKQSLNPAQLRLVAVQDGIFTGQRKAIRGFSPKSKPKKSLEVEPITRKLHFIKSTGEIFDEDSEEFKKLFTDYGKTHLGSGVGEVALRAIEYIRQPIRVHGRAMGIVPMKDSKISYESIGNGRYKNQVYRLKPCEIPGFSSKSPLAAKIRIPFVLDQQNKSNAYILGVMDKDEMLPFLRKLGIRISSEGQK